MWLAKNKNVNKCADSLKTKFPLFSYYSLPRLKTLQFVFLIILYLKVFRYRIIRLVLDFAKCSYPYFLGIDHPGFETITGIYEIIAWLALNRLYLSCKCITKNLSSRCDIQLYRCRRPQLVFLQEQISAISFTLYRRVFTAGD